MLSVASLMPSRNLRDECNRDHSSLAKPQSARSKNRSPLFRASPLCSLHPKDGDLLVRTAICMGFGVSVWQASFAFFASLAWGRSLRTFDTPAMSRFVRWRRCECGIDPQAGRRFPDRQAAWNRLPIAEIGGRTCCSRLCAWGMPRRVGVWRW